MSENYPLKVEGLYGDDRGYYSKGHQGFDAFLAEVRASWEPEAILSVPRHLWWRCIPEPPGAESDYTFHEAVPHSRGAFPVTCVYLAYLDAAQRLHLARLAYD